MHKQNVKNVKDLSINTWGQLCVITEELDRLAGKSRDVICIPNQRTFKQMK